MSMPSSKQNIVSPPKKSSMSKAKKDNWFDEDQKEKRTDQGLHVNLRKMGLLSNLRRI